MSAHIDTVALLHAHGLDVDPKQLDSDLVAAIKALPPFYDSKPEQEELTATEIEILLSGGLDPTPRADTGPDPVLIGVFAYVNLLRTGLTTTEAAERIGVSTARIRQCIHDRSLFALRVGRAWKLPLFQFTEAGELPGWGEVARVLPRDASPVAVERWMLNPNPDLVAGEDETPMSPRVWLQEGRPAQAVASIAVELS